MSTFTLEDVYFEFVECLVHQLLCMRSIYPQYIFERRLKYGISLWECRHEEIRTYIKRVLTNSSSLVTNGVAKRVIFATYNEKGEVVDHLFIDCDIIGRSRGGTDDEGNDIALLLCELEEQLRTCILKAIRLDGRLPKYLPEWTWALLLQCSSSPARSSSRWTADDGTENGADNDIQSMLLEEALTGGEWVTDNAQLASHILKERRSVAAETGGIRDGGVVIPVVSFTNKLMEMQIGAYAFN